MKRFTAVWTLLGMVPLVSGCVPMMAASALSAAAQKAQGTPTDNQSLQPQAREACTAQAAQYGSVHIIDVEQHSLAKIIVWGTVDDGKQRRSFECDFGTKVTRFVLRPIGRT
jgi:hypothetical protein